jgi:uncharacterized damage-inducible protein DinB
MGMTSVELLRRLREHQVWVRQKLIAAATNLSSQQLQQRFPIGQGTLLATLAHLYAAEFVWMAAIDGDPNPISPFSIRFDALRPLLGAWESLDLRWTRLFVGLDESDLQRPIMKRPSLGGAATATPLADVLLHLPLHASHTAAQAINMLRQLGISPPDPMLISLSRAQHAAKSPS